MTNNNTWVDTPAYAFADVIKLTRYTGARIHAYAQRKQFRPTYRQPHGRIPGGGPRRTYTARDILHLLLLGPAVQFGVHILDGDQYPKPQALARLLEALDAQIDRTVAGLPGANEKLIFPRQYGPWSYLVLDLAMLAETQLKRIQEYGK